MTQDTVEQIIHIVFLILGLLSILGGLFSKKISRALGQKPAETLYENPQFQKSVRMQGFLAQIAGVLGGIVMVVFGLTDWLIPFDMGIIISWVFLGLLFLVIATVVGVILINWRGHNHD